MNGSPPRCVLRPVALRILFGSFFRAVPRMRGLLLVGWASLGLTWLPNPSASRWAFGAASAVFLVALPALFAGHRFRLMASHRTRLLWPGFADHLTVAVFALFVALAVLAGGIARRMDAGPAAGAAVAVFALGSLVFWIGFVPYPWRLLPAGSLVVALLLLEPVAAFRAASSSGALLAAVAGVATLGWGAFLLWFRWTVRARRSFDDVHGRAWRLPLDFGVGAGARPGSRDGTLLLGLSDDWRSIGIRAIIGGVAVPAVLTAALTLPTGTALERALADPVLLFVSQIYGLAFLIHLAQRVGARWPSLWLQCAGDRAALYRRASFVAYREWAAYAVVLCAGWGCTWAAGFSPAAATAWFLVTWLTGALVQIQWCLAPDTGGSALSAFLAVHLLVMVAGFVTARFTDPRILLGPTAVQVMAFVLSRRRALGRVSGRLTALVVLLALAACTRDASEPPSAEAQPRVSRARLEALGYLAAYREPRPGGSGVVRDDPARRAPGLTLVVSSHRPGAVLMDAGGEVLHEWHASLAQLAPRIEEPKDWWRRAVLLPDGGVLAIFDYQALVRLDRDSRVVWKALGAYHHDAFVDAQGRTWALWSRRGPNHRVGFVRVLGPDGRVERQIDLVRALRDSPYRSLLRGDKESDDLLHTNTLAPLAASLARRVPRLEENQLLLSFRNLDAVAALDPEAERVEWLLTGLWDAQHTPSLLPDGGLLVFDNRGPGGRRSRVLEVGPLTQEVLWSWDGGDEELYSPVMGAAQGLANGDVLVVDSVGGRIFEVARDGTVVWEYRNPHTIEKNGRVKVATLPHAERLPADAPLEWLGVSR